MTEAHRCEQLAQSFYAEGHGETGTKSNTGMQIRDNLKFPLVNVLVEGYREQSVETKISSTMTHAGAKLFIWKNINK